MEAVGIIQRIIFRSAVVEAEDLFGDIAVKMKRFYSNVGSAQTALQQAPEVLDALSMDLTANVFLNVVDRCMNVILSMQCVVGRKTVRVDGRTTLNLIQNLVSAKSLASGWG